jgi:NADPH:quinone reductase-like Zn-dependent oxidoreductase
MKAAVLHQLGNAPEYEDFTDPVPGNASEILINVKAAAIKNLDKGRASGQHYASYKHLPVLVGIDGVGILENGRRVYAQGITGMMAEKALINKNNYVELPDKIDDATAAALPNAVLGAGMALLYRAQIKKDEVVLINGATGVTGKLAVQLAKYYGASTIAVTGRNSEQLAQLKSFGADLIISLKQDDEHIIQQIKELHASTPVDIVIDYLWAKPVELILRSLKGGGTNHISHRVRLVTVGSMAGEHITLESGTLRSSAIEILGSGFGSISKDEWQQYTAKILPEMFQLAANGGLVIETETEPLSNIKLAWQKEAAPGKRIVVII